MMPGTSDYLYFKDYGRFLYHFDCCVLNNIFFFINSKIPYWRFGLGRLVEKYKISKKIGALLSISIIFAPNFECFYNKIDTTLIKGSIWQVIGPL